MEDRMLKWFDCSYLPPGDLRDMSKTFSALASTICELIEPGPERTVVLRKLLETKDAAARAMEHPGG
jgi:hypothetical protein